MNSLDNAPSTRTAALNVGGPLRRSPLRNRDLSNLDVLRSIAVLLVFLCHLCGTMGIPGLAALGHLGVLLFFVHTSLVLMMSMERLRLRGTALFSSFMLRRVFRIYPLSILTIALVIAFRIPEAGSVYVAPSWGAIVSHLALIQNLTGSRSIYGVLWSLPYEVQMYLALPFLFLAFRGGSAMRWLLLGWCCATLIAVSECVLRGAVVEDDVVISRYVPCFLGGVLAWQALKRWQQPRMPSWCWPAWMAIIIVVYRVIGTLRGFNLAEILYHFSHPSAPWPAYTAQWSLPCDIVIEGGLCAAIGLSIPSFREMSNRVVCVGSEWIARYSYGIYLAHSAAIWLCYNKMHFGARVLAPIASVSITLLLSMLCYHAVEKPFIEVGKALARRLTGPRASTRSIAVVERDEPTAP